MATRFQVGKTYWTRSICDSECIVRVEVVARTAKTIRAKAGGITTAPKTLRIFEYDGVEQVRPWGNYSMCPIVGADRTMESV